MILNLQHVQFQLEILPKIWWFATTVVFLKKDEDVRTSLLLLATLQHFQKCELGRWTWCSMGPIFHLTMLTTNNKTLLFSSFFQPIVFTKIHTFLLHFFLKPNSVGTICESLFALTNYRKLSSCALTNFASFFFFWLRLHKKNQPTELLTIFWLGCTSVPAILTPKECRQCQKCIKIATFAFFVESVRTYMIMNWTFSKQHSRVSYHITKCQLIHGSSRILSICINYNKSLIW